MTLVFIIFTNFYIATLFLEFWKRRQVRLAFEWHLLNYESEEVRAVFNLLLYFY